MGFQTTKGRDVEQKTGAVSPCYIYASGTLYQRK